MSSTLQSTGASQAAGCGFSGVPETAPPPSSNVPLPAAMGGVWTDEVAAAGAMAVLVAAVVTFVVVDDDGSKGHVAGPAGGEGLSGTVPGHSLPGKGAPPSMSTSHGTGIGVPTHR